MRIVKAFLIICLACLPAARAAEVPGQSPQSGRSVLEILKNFGKDTLGLESQGFLSPEQAFILSVEAKNAASLIARWGIADGYYLYRDKFTFKLNSPEVRLGRITLPPAEIKEEDPTFGRVEIYTGQLEVEIPLIREADGAIPLGLQVGYQGCAERGICYPPIAKSVPVTLAALPAKTPSQPNLVKAAQEPISAEEGLAHRLASEKAGWILLSFFGFGLLLSFTPCIFPTIPILSSLIVGQAEGLTPRRAFSLSLVFVLSMAVAYAMIGLIAGLFGQNLQAVFQNTWVLITFAGVFVILALSMFGLFEIQLPSSWQTGLSRLSNKQSRGAFHGVAVMGLLSALIVGPCIAPPLAGAFIYIGQTGDAVLGGGALFSLGLGMGIPLLVIGTSAGRLLPKAGAWMQAIKAVFGVVLLGVAIWLLERVLPAPVILLLWGLLLIISAIYMGALDALESVASGWRRLSKGLGLALLVYGALLIVGAAGGADDVFRPLGSMALMEKASKGGIQSLGFKPVKGVEGLKQALSSAQGKPVMLDLYADWCVECKQMERHTFSDQAVQRALSGMVLLKADVTANDRGDRDLLRALGVYGPPATLFYDTEGVERRGHRLVGFIGAGEFRTHLEQVFQSPCTLRQC